MNDDLMLIGVPSNIERSAADGPITRRSLDTNAPYNRSLGEKLQALVDKDYSVGNILDTLPVIDSVEKLKQVLSEVIIRFDTRPDFYTKKDYQMLISLLGGAILFLQGEQEIHSGNEDILAVEQKDGKTIITPQVGQLTDAPEDADGVYTGTDNNEKRIATIGDIRTYINNKLTWIEQ